MVVITNKSNNVVLKVAKVVTITNDSNLRADDGFLFEESDVVVYRNVQAVPPEDVDVFFKYCFTEADAFYLNPEYIPPNKYGISYELQDEILADYTAELIKEGVI